MADQIKVNYTAVADAVKEMNKAIATYNSLAETGFDTAITTLDGMNSDYVDKLQQVLDCLNPKVKEKINNSMDEYTKKASSAADAFKTTDEGLSDSYKGE